MDAKVNHQQKYDRQLRLWGAQGQASLGAARVLLIGAGPTGSETLKNLVLPGVGSFEVLDGQKVEPKDLANNFFAGGPSALGLSRAKVVSELLCELNPDVQGSYREAFPEEIIVTDKEYFARFTLIIASQLRGQLLTQLASICESSSIPLLVVRSYGLVGYVRVALQTHCIVESKPDPEQYDLRLSDPFPELLEHALSIDMSALDNAEHGHTPYIIILLQQMQNWKKENDGKLPQSAEEKSNFKERVKNASRNFAMELNFQEAYAEAYRAYVVRELPYEVTELFDKDEVCNISENTASFYVLVRALKDFIANEGGGSPPLSGQIPDMTGSSQMYINLQELYQAKAKLDFEAMRARVQQLLQSSSSSRIISDEEILLFCKNTYNVLVVSSGSILEEYSSSPEALKESVMMTMMDPPEDPVQTPLHWYIALRATDLFFEKNGRYPGSSDESLVPDTANLWAEIQYFSSTLETELPTLSKKHAQEMTRYGAAEIHNIAAIVGGIASQEAVKIITKQYVPIQNTLMYNGICGTAGVYSL